MYAFKDEGADCFVGMGAGQCVRGTCDPIVKSIARRAEKTGSFISTKNGAVTIHGYDVKFAMPEKLGTADSPYEPAVSFSVVTLKDSLEEVRVFCCSVGSVHAAS